jgi:hypothetical protein
MMSTATIVLIVVVVVILAALAVVLPRALRASRLRARQNEIGQRREQVVDEHRDAAQESAQQAEIAERRARMAEQEARAVSPITTSSPTTSESASPAPRPSRPIVLMRQWTATGSAPAVTEPRVTGGPSSRGRARSPVSRGTGRARSPTGSGPRSPT